LDPSSTALEDKNKRSLFPPIQEVTVAP